MNVKTTYVREPNPDTIRFLADILHEFIKKERGRGLKEKEAGKFCLPALNISSNQEKKAPALISLNKSVCLERS